MGRKRKSSEVATYRKRSMVFMCIPPKGKYCHLQDGAPENYNSSRAKQHALCNPGHVMVYRTITEYRYALNS